MTSDPEIPDAELPDEGLPTTGPPGASDREPRAAEAPEDVDAASVFEEIRRARSETSFARATVARVLGLVVLAAAVWVVSRNVTWGDTLRLTPEGEAAVALDGTIVGDWRSDEIGFRLEADSELLPKLRTAAPGKGPAEALDEAARLGLELTVGTEAVQLPGGAVALQLGPGIPEWASTVERIEWRPGMLRTLREIEVLRLLPALGFLMLASLCVATRWWRLLALAGCPTRWYDAFRYTYSGLFFNAVLPGINGGDVARAVAVVRRYPERRSNAFMTVVIDRALGLIGMILIGTALVLSTDARVDALKLPVSLFCAAILVGGALFFHPGLRRKVRFERLVARLPQGERLLRLDNGARALLRHPGEVAIALVFSFGNHVFNGLAVYAAALALGSGLGFQDWMTTMAISNTLAAVPISPNGLGVGEVLFGSLAELLGSTYAIGVATSLVYRLCLYGMSLLGGLVMLLPAARSSEAETGLSSAPF